ncbi:MAG: hypothetical protein AAF738_05080, partial [Bacteroidota bacterium]
IFLIIGGLVEYEVIKAQGRNQLNDALNNLEYNLQSTEVVERISPLGINLPLPKKVRLNFLLVNKNQNVSGRINYYKGEIIYAKRYMLGMVELTQGIDIPAGGTVPYSVDIVLDYAQAIGEIVRLGTEGFRLGSLVVKGRLGVQVGNRNLTLPYDYPIQVLADA